MLTVTTTFHSDRKSAESHCARQGNSSTIRFIFHLGVYSHDVDVDLGPALRGLAEECDLKWLRFGDHGISLDFNVMRIALGPHPEIMMRLGVDAFTPTPQSLWMQRENLVNIAGLALWNYDAIITYPPPGAADSTDGRVPAPSQRESGTTNQAAPKGSTMSAPPPKAFISYSYDSADHKQWVRQFAACLLEKGVDTMLDQWDAVHGDQLPEFMERAIRENDFVLIICTPKYKERSDARVGGVGYEGDVITGEILGRSSAGDRQQRIQVQRKFIPVLRSGTWTNSSPSWLVGKYGVDLRGDPYSDEQFIDLLKTLHGHRAQAPPVGPNPFHAAGVLVGPSNIETSPEPDEPIKIQNIIVDEVTMPRLDGTPGSALYAIPLQLSRSPSWAWAEIFGQVWNRPPEFTSMHRPGIARIEGDRIILDGTTLDEFRRYHRDTLKLVMKETNRRYQEWDRSRRQREAQQRKQMEDHEKRLRENVKGLGDFSDFDD